MTLQGCGIDRPAPIPPAPLVIRVKDTPPADLLACAERAKPLPTDALAIIPAPLRTALIDLARVVGRNADRLERLVRWSDPAACPSPETK
jgi:hypothetical protein